MILHHIILPQNHPQVTHKPGILLVALLPDKHSHSLGNAISVLYHLSFFQFAHSGYPALSDFP